MESLKSVTLFASAVCAKLIEEEYFADPLSSQNSVYCAICAQSEFGEALHNYPKDFFQHDKVRKIRHGKLLPLVGIKRKLKSTASVLGIPQ